jgi:hypothetical protein
LGVEEGGAVIPDGFREEGADLMANETRGERAEAREGVPGSVGDRERGFGCCSVGCLAVSGGYGDDDPQVHVTGGGDGLKAVVDKDATARVLGRRVERR